MCPLGNESGWKDTVIVFPEQVTRLAVRWTPTDIATNATPNKLIYPFDPSDNFQCGYVWHYHIIAHEDNEMMRPNAVQPNPAAPLIRPLQKRIHY